MIFNYCRRFFLVGIALLLNLLSGDAEAEIRIISIALYWRYSSTFIKSDGNVDVKNIPDDLENFLVERNVNFPSLSKLV